MRGFPIVSLGSLVGSRSKCMVLMPQFEVDQYYQGDEEQTIQTYKERYPTAVSSGWIKSYTVNPNNLEMTEGTQSTVSLSYGFYLNNGLGYYEIRNKLENISLYRVDSFYVTTLYQYGLISFMTKTSKTFAYSNYVSIYINLPSILEIGYNNGFSSGSKVNEVFINSPKTQDVYDNFLFNNTTITDLYMNAPNITEITGTNLLLSTNRGETTGIYLHSLTTSDINRLYTLIYNNRYTSSATNLYKGTTCTYSDFDIRYWSEEQNSTGSDR